MRKRDNFEGQRMAVFPHSVISLMETNALTQNLYVTDAGFFPTAKGHYVHRPHGSPQHIIFICTAGKGRIICEDEETELTANHYYILPKGKAHTYLADEQDPWTIYWMHFDGFHTSYFMEGIAQKSVDIPIGNFALRDNIFLILNEMYLILENSFSESQLAYCSILFSYVLGSLRYMKQTQIVEKGAVAQVIQFIKDNYARKLTLQAMAAHCGLSTSHLCLLFKRQTSRTPIEYLTMLRVQIACKLLLSSNAKVKDIAADLGFDDPYYFTRVFTKMMGKSPKAYRKREG